MRAGQHPLTMGHACVPLAFRAVQQFAMLQDHHFLAEGNNAACTATRCTCCAGSASASKRVHHIALHGLRKPCAQAVRYARLCSL